MGRSCVVRWLKESSVVPCVRSDARKAFIYTHILYCTAHIENRLAEWAMGQIYGGIDPVLVDGRGVKSPTIAFCLNVNLCNCLAVAVVAGEGQKNPHNPILFSASSLGARIGLKSVTLGQRN